MKKQESLILNKKNDKQIYKHETNPKKNDEIYIKIPQLFLSNFQQKNITFYCIIQTASTRLSINHKIIKNSKFHKNPNKINNLRHPYIFIFIFIFII